MDARVAEQDPPVTVCGELAMGDRDTMDIVNEDDFAELSRLGESIRKDLEALPRRPLPEFWKMSARELVALWDN
jgi:hypothetical protein